MKYGKAQHGAWRYVSVKYGNMQHGTWRYLSVKYGNIQHGAWRYLSVKYGKTEQDAWRHILMGRHGVKQDEQICIYSAIMHAKITSLNGLRTPTELSTKESTDRIMGSHDEVA